MSAPAKFLFDVDFSTSRAKQPEQAMSRAALETALAEAETRGYRAGVAAARADATVEAERRVAIAFERIGGGLEHLAQGLRAIEGRLEAEAVEVATAVASKLAPQLIAREPFAELAALAAECFNHLVGAPHVVVRVNDALHLQARDRLEEIARAHGFAGRVVVLAEPDIATGDCRIEWADGGVARDEAATLAVIDDAVARYVAARTTH